MFAVYTRFLAATNTLDPLRLGALSTRTAHPHFIYGMEAFLNRIGLPVRLVNPYRHRTKGEMVDACKDREFLAGEIGNSMSCSSPAKARYQGLSPRHCGHCIPCLIRRASIRAGLGMPDPTLYTIADLGERTLRTDRSEGVHIRSFQLMVNRLARQPDLARILVHKPGPLLHAHGEVSAYAEVFRRGVMEVSELLEGVRARPGR